MKSSKQFPRGIASLKRKVRVALAAAYREQGWTWEAIAKELGVSRKQIQRWRADGLL